MSNTSTKIKIAVKKAEAKMNSVANMLRTAKHIKYGDINSLEAAFAEAESNYIVLKGILDSYEAEHS